MSKLYTKRVWYNDKTKLSAHNLNHIEDGIEAVANAIEELEEHGVPGGSSTPVETHTHANKEILDATTAVFTTELRQRFNNKTTVSVNSVGTSDNTVKYITVDGVEYKLAGSEALPVYSEDGMSLDYLTDSGIYEVSNAADIPTNTTDTGILNVSALADGRCYQEWLSTTNRAVRIFDPEEAGLMFYVNDELVPQGEVHLAAGGTYTLRGDLSGSVIIGNGETAVNHRTKINLDGVNIQTSEYATCINYTPSGSKVAIEIINNSDNYFMVNLEGGRSDDDLGALHSENNMMLTGVGKLYIKNTKGHGIRASELVITGNIHAYLDTIHDAVHGGKLLKMTGGYWEVENANDAFSASQGGNNDGKLLILGGEYNIHACNEAAFEGKSANGIKRIINSSIILGEGVSKLFNASNASQAKYEIQVFKGLNEIVNNSGKALPLLSDIKSLFGNAYLAIDGDPVDVTGTEITLSPTSDTEYLIKGNWTGKKIITNPASGVKVDFRVKDLYYETDPEEIAAISTVLNAAPFIEHLGDKRIKFSIDEFCLAYISKQTIAAIKTAKNIQVKGKGDLFLTCAEGEAITAPNGYTVLGGDGLRSITNSHSGITTASLRLGEDPDDIDEKFATETSKRGASDTATYIINNTQDITLSSTDTLITYMNRVIATQYMTGLAILGAIQAADEASILEAQSGEVLQKEGTPYENAAMVYALANSLIKNGVAKVYIEPLGINTTIPAFDALNTNVWTVYAGDGYSKEQVNANFVAKSDYNALLLTIADLTRRLEALEPEPEPQPEEPTTTEAELSEDGNLTLNNVTLSEDGDLDLGTLATINEDGSLIL